MLVTGQVVLTPDELNAMQYACGYVPHKLLKKYEMRRGQKAKCFVECLGNMAVVSDDSHDTSFHTQNHGFIKLTGVDYSHSMMKPSCFLLK